MSRRMNQQTCEPSEHSTKATVSLAEQFRLAMLPPSEEQIYQAAMQQKLWTIDEFAALMGGLTPENYKVGSKGIAKMTDEVFAKREAAATKIFSQFLDDMEKTTIARDFILADKSMYMSAWKYIKWVAINNIPMKKRFFNALPFELMELYFEFQPTSIALRTQSHYSRAYHEALYLEHAEKLIKQFPLLTPKDIFKHPHMENIRRMIRDLGGRYTQRTLRESWLPKLIKKTRGRPKKLSSSAT